MEHVVPFHTEFRGEKMRKFGEKWRNDVMMTSSMGQISQKKKITPQTVPSPYIKDQGAKNCKSKAFSSQKKK